MKYIILLFILVTAGNKILAQEVGPLTVGSIKGRVMAEGRPLPSISVILEGKRKGTVTNEEGFPFC